MRVRQGADRARCSALYELRSEGPASARYIVVWGTKYRNELGLLQCGQIVFPNQRRDREVLRQSGRLLRQRGRLPVVLRTSGQYESQRPKKGGKHHLKKKTGRRERGFCVRLEQL